MTNSKRKALYLFLTSLLGILLLLMLHRSLFVIYDILSGFFPSNPLFAVEPRVVFTVDFFSMLLAMFLGGWYGVWLGLDWYKMIYEERESREWFHGFLPHHWRGYHARKKHKASSEFTQFQDSSTGEKTPKRIVVKSAAVSSSPKIESFSSFRTAPKDTAWSFDDVEAPSAKPKRKVVAKKRVVRKKVAKQES